VVAACVFALRSGKLRRGHGPQRRHAWGVILFGAYMLNDIMVQLRPQTLAGTVAGIPLPGSAIMLLIVGFDLALDVFAGVMPFVVSACLRS
jgi:uncharacterized membrane protein